MTLDCDNVQKQLPFYNRTDMSAEEYREISRHLAGCSLCQQELKTIRRTDQSIRNALATTPIEDVQSAKFAVISQLPSPSPVRSWLDERRPPQLDMSPSLGAVISVVLIVTILLLGLPLLNRGENTERLALLPTLRVYAQTAGAGILGTDVLPDAELVLDTSLPTGSDSMPAFRQLDPQPLTLADARHIADRLGMRGTFYKVTGSDTYVLFDGSRRLRTTGNDGFVYTDNSARVTDASVSPLPFARAAQIAEGFLQRHDLLDGAYRIEPFDPDIETLHSFGTGDIPSAQTWVQFVYVIDDWPVRTLYRDARVSVSTAQVSVTPDERIAELTYNPLALQRTGMYPIRTAHEAWEQLQSHRPQRLISFALYPQSQETSTTTWFREYQPGERAHLYGLPVVYRPAEEEGQPRVRLQDVWLRAPSAELDTLIDQGNGRLHVWGRIEYERSGELALNVEGWEVVSSVIVSREPAFRGTVERKGERVLLHREDERVFILPDAPDELPDDAGVSGKGWATNRIDEGYSVLEWSALRTPPANDLAVGEVQGPGFTTRVERSQPQEITPPQELTVEHVSLVYYAVPDAALINVTDSAESPLRIVQPLWRFAGHTDAGDAFEVFVQAVSDEFLEK